MAIYLGPNKVTLQGYITDEQESSDAVRFIDYDGEILHEYSKDEFLALSSMPANPSTNRFKPIINVTAIDITNNLINGITNSFGKIDFSVRHLFDITEYPIIRLDGILFSYDNIKSLIDAAWDAIDVPEQEFHYETESFTVNNITYKIIMEWSGWTGYDSGIDTIGTIQFFKLQENLVPQGWNWSLSDAKEYVEEFGYLNIGQMYTTESGDTEIDVEFPEDSVRLSPYLGIAVKGGVDIDWGDNSTHSTVTGASLGSQIRTQHTYSQPGNYTIKIHVNSGSFAFYETNKYPLLNTNNSNLNYNIVYSSKVKNIRVGRNCFISAYAFYYCSSLQSITIPNTVTSIGVDAFENCYSLKSITIPNTVTSIGNSSFYECYSLKSITIPNGVTSIGGSVFYDCYSLSSITIPNTVTSIGSNAFRGCFSIKVKTLKYLTYINYFKEVSIPNTITSIKACAFQNCYSLKSITIPNGVTSIGAYAFRGCYSLSSITLSNTITSIYSYSFYGCYSLPSITIPNGVTSIGAYAFNNCYSLKSITIPNTVTSIGNYSFEGCHSLKSITIPNTVTSINNTAFSGCYSLPSITIPNGVTSIDNYAFYDCYSLQSITIPNTVTSIGSCAFYECCGMKEYHIKPTTPPTLGSTSFHNIPSDCIIYVPQGSLSAYQSATNWSTYADYMQEETN